VLWLLELDWREASEADVAAMVGWLRVAENSQRRRRAESAAAGTVNLRTGKPRPGPGYAPRTINHALLVTWNLAALEIIWLRYDHGLRRLFGHGGAGGEVAGARPARAGSCLASRVG
jgi:hypothetical protein